MKITLEKVDGCICHVIEEVYSNFIMRTSEGNEISICMRDDSLDINVMPKGKAVHNWWHIDMQQGKIISEKELLSNRKVTDEETEGCSNAEGI